MNYFIGNYPRISLRWFFLRHMCIRGKNKFYWNKRKSTVMCGIFTSFSSCQNDPLFLTLFNVNNFEPAGVFLGILKLNQLFLELEIMSSIHSSSYGMTDLIIQLQVLLTFAHLQVLLANLSKHHWPYHTFAKYHWPYHSYHITRLWSSKICCVNDKCNLPLSSLFIKSYRNKRFTILYWGCVEMCRSTKCIIPNLEVTRDIWK